MLIGPSLRFCDHSQITERLYTGGMIASADELDSLLAEGITHVIDAMSEQDDCRLLRTHPKVTYLWNGVLDDGVHPKPAEWFEKAVIFALEALSHPGATIYTHCAAGVNRGPSLTYAIMRAIGYSGSEAYLKIKERRPQAMMAYANDADKALFKLGWIR
jgi:protein-tyrosine phosphatase